MRILEVINSGCWRANSASCDVSASSVLCLRCSGVNASAAERPSFGSDSISAKSAASSGEVEVCAGSASSLSSFACVVSSCAIPAARSIWLMIGWNAPSVAAASRNSATAVRSPARRSSSAAVSRPFLYRPCRKGAPWPSPALARGQRHRSNSISSSCRPVRQAAGGHGPEAFH